MSGFATQRENIQDRSKMKEETNSGHIPNKQSMLETKFTVNLQPSQQPYLEPSQVHQNPSGSHLKAASKPYQLRPHPAHRLKRPDSPAQPRTCNRNPKAYCSGRIVVKECKIYTMYFKSLSTFLLHPLFVHRE